MGIVNIFKGKGKIIFGTAAVTLVLTYGIIGGERILSSNKFCLSCHSMSYNYEELKQSTHFGALGVNPECQDCHLPPQFFKRIESHIIDGARALLGELRHDLSTKEKFDKFRAEYAHNARINIKKRDSSPCRVCHKAPSPSSDDAIAEHKKMETEKKTCIDCHQNLVHEQVPEEDLDMGLKEERIVLKEEKK